MPEIKPIFASGNSGAITRKLNSAGTDYIGEPKKWFSDEAGDVLVSVSATFSYEAENHASGNNPSHATTYPEPTGTGTITFFGMEDEEWTEIAPVVNDEWGIGFAPDIDRVQFGFAFDVNLSNGSKTKIFITRCQVNGIPEISTTTNTQTGKTIQQVAIPIQIFSIYANGERLPIYRRINSIKRASSYAALKETLVLPINVEPIE